MHVDPKPNRVPFWQLALYAVGAAASGITHPVRRMWKSNNAIDRYALCHLTSAAGDSLLATDAVRGADVYITADLRHHPASEAREQAAVGGGPALLDVSHWASEWLWLDVAADQLRDALPGVTVEVSELRTDPWDFAVLQ